MERRAVKSSEPAKVALRGNTGNRLLAKRDQRGRKSWEAREQNKGCKDKSLSDQGLNALESSLT